jgi:N-acetylneuraminic acid mutarotase
MSAQCLGPCSEVTKKGLRMGTRVISRLTARLVVFSLAMAFIASAFSVSAPNAGASSVFSWTSETSMGATVSQAAVVGAANGTVYVMGGVLSIAYVAVANAYSYNPGTGEWKTLTSMPYATRGATGAMGLDGKVYVFGGAGGSSYTQIYDPETNSWSLGAAMLDGAWEAKAATVTNGSIWVVGGEGVTAGYAQVYDPVGDSWFVGTAAPAAVECGAMVAVGYDLYYSGGGVAGYTATTNFYKFNSSAGSWETTLTQLPAARAAHAMVVGVDGLIYVVGGSSDAFNSGGDSFSSAAVYDPATDKWSSVASMSYARKYLGATVTPDGRVMAVGGNSPSAVLDVVESLQLYEFQYTIGLSASSVRAGESVLLNLDAQFTYINESYSVVSWYLKSDADGTVYSPGSLMIPTETPASVTVSVPALAPPGNYKVVVQWSVFAPGVSEDVEEELALQVLAAPAATDALIADLEAQIANLQAMLADENANVTAIQAELVQLGTTLAALQTQLNSMQDQADRTEEKADSASMYSMVNLVLVIIVIVLLAMMFVMARKKP